MNVPNKQPIPQIKVVLDNETIRRIDSGPLRNTNGRGKASWLRNLINRELETFEAIQSNMTQIDPSVFTGERA